ncbi:isoprenoid synthase domain-containing protein [Aspergillus heterothallicus]
MAVQPLVVPGEQTKRSGVVSIFPNIIHPLYALPIDDLKKLQTDFNAQVQMEIDTKTIAELEGFGEAHVTAFAMPYCLPERVSLITRFTEITFLNDDYYDEASKEKVAESTYQLRNFFEDKARREALATDMHIQKQNLQATLLLEMLQVDVTLTKEIMATYNNILDATSLPKHHNVTTYEEYAPFRIANSGIQVWQGMCCWGMALWLPADEKALLAPIIDAVQRSTTLINDYCSWAKEGRRYFNLEPEARELPVNAVCIFMQELGCTEREALDKVRAEIVVEQKRHVAMIQELDNQEGPLPQRWHDYFAAAQHTAIGSEFWATLSRRYPSKESLGQPACELVNGALRYITGSGDGAKKLASPITSGLNGTVNRPNLETEISESTTANLPHINHSSNGKLTNGSSFTCEDICEADNEMVMSPYNYIASLPSKGVRDKFIDALNTWLQVPAFTLSSIKHIVGLLHHSSLLLDDIEDDSTLRRGHPTAHMLYGPAQTINSANYVFVSVLKEGLKLRSPSAPMIVIDEVQNMQCGQASDLSWKYHTHIPTVDEYMTMVDQKTGSMFRLCVRLMEAESAAPPEKQINTASFTRLLGRYFQIRDDYQNLVSPEVRSCPAEDAYSKIWQEILMDKLRSGWLPPDLAFNTTSIRVNKECPNPKQKSALMVDSGQIQQKITRLNLNES